MHPLFWLVNAQSLLWNQYSKFDTFDALTNYLNIISLKRTKLIGQWPKISKNVKNPGRRLCKYTLKNVWIFTNHKMLRNVFQKNSIFFSSTESTTLKIRYSEIFEIIQKYSKIHKNFENMKFLIARESKITFSKCQVLNMSSGLSRFSVFVAWWLSYRLLSFYRGVEIAIR